jgi:hypothetical protein
MPSSCIVNELVVFVVLMAEGRLQLQVDLPCGQDILEKHAVAIYSRLEICRFSVMD